MTQAFDDAGSRLSRFLLLQCLVNAAYGSLFGLGLYFIGVPHALLWGFIAAFLRFVPYVGTFAAAAFPIAMAIAVFPGWRQAGIAFAVFLVLELTLSNIVEPMLYGANTGVSSLAILVATVFWATLWGPVGLILSTPLTLCLVVLGRYVPQLHFLEVVLGDEPALPLEQLFYQRLLADDQEEARSIAEVYLKDHTVESLYETIILPALRLAEQDYYIDALDDDARRFILRSTRELIEDVGDRLVEDSPPANEIGYEKSGVPGFAESYANIACIPVRGGSDELVAIILAQLLRGEGLRALHVRSAAMEDMLAEVSRRGSNIVCVACLPPFPTASARALCKRLKSSFPQMRIIVGLLQLEGGVSAARERLGAGCLDLVITTLAEAVSEVHRLATREPGVESLTEKR